MEQYEWEQLSPEQKKIQLYLEQKKTLETFLAHGAISRAQFDKSLTDLTVKMGMRRRGVKLIEVFDIYLTVQLYF